MSTTTITDREELIAIARRIARHTRRIGSLRIALEHEGREVEEAMKEQQRLVDRVRYSMTPDRVGEAAP